jgi:hypothetical protein
MTRPGVPAQPARQPYPWVVPDLFRWFFLLGLSIVGLVVAWWGVSGTARTGTQITWINIGVAAVVVGGLGNMTWLLQGRRAVALRRRELLARLPARTTVAVAPVASSPREKRVAVPGASRHHRPDCAAVAGKRVEEASVAKHERAGRRPCGLCGGG